MKNLLIVSLFLLSHSLFGQWTPLCGLPTYPIQSGNQFATFIDASFINLNQCVSSDRYYVSPSSGFSSFLRYTNDGGATWNDNIAMSTTNCVCGTGASLIDVVPHQNTFYASVANHGFNKSTDGGITWNYIANGSYIKMFAFDTSNFYLMANSSPVYQVSKYQNGNTSILSTIPNLSAKDFHFTDNLTGYAVGDSGTYDVIIKTLDGAYSWSTIYSDSALHGNDIFFSSPDIGYAVGNSGRILKTSDAGATWTNLTSGTTNNLNSVWFVNDSTGFAGGDSGVILNTNDYGNSWTSTIVGSSYSKVVKMYFIGDTLGLALLKSHGGPGTYGSFYSINLNGTTGNSEPDEMSSVCIFPNPNKGNFSIQIMDAFQGNSQITIEILDLNGKTVFKENLNNISNSINIQCNHLMSGLYLLRMFNGDANYCNRLFQVYH